MLLEVVESSLSPSNEDLFSSFLFRKSKGGLRICTVHEISMDCQLASLPGRKLAGRVTSRSKQVDSNELYGLGIFG